MVFMILFFLIGIMGVYYIISTAICIAKEINCNTLLSLATIDIVVFVMGYKALKNPNIYNMLNSMGFDILMLVILILGTNYYEKNNKNNNN